MSESARPDVIVTDISMPRLGGVDLARSIRQRSDHLADTPIVFFTALPASDPMVHEATTLARSRVLQKPGDLRQVGRVVGELLQSPDGQASAGVFAPEPNGHRSGTADDHRPSPR